MSDTYSLNGFDIFALSKKLVVACYTLTANLPKEEKTNLVQYIRNAALAAHINIVQGAFLKKKKAKERFLTGAQHSLVVIDAAIDVLVEVELAKEEDTLEAIELTSQCYELLDRLKKDK